MTKQVFTVKFNYSISAEELKKIMSAVASKFSSIPGCCWKIWVINANNNEAGGVYLFESANALELYKASTLFAPVVTNPAFSNLQTNGFDVVENASIITGAPIGIFM